jgi:hypothetical protein
MDVSGCSLSSIDRVLGPRGCSWVLVDRSGGSAWPIVEPIDHVVGPRGHLSTVGVGPHGRSWVLVDRS